MSPDLPQPQGQLLETEAAFGVRLARVAPEMMTGPPQSRLFGGAIRTLRDDHAHQCTGDGLARELDHPAVHEACDLELDLAQIDRVSEEDLLAAPDRNEALGAHLNHHLLSLVDLLRFENQLEATVVCSPGGGDLRIQHDQLSVADWSSLAVEHARTKQKGILRRDRFGPRADRSKRTALGSGFGLEPGGGRSGGDRLLGARRRSPARLRMHRDERTPMVRGRAHASPRSPVRRQRRRSRRFFERVDMARGSAMEAARRGARGSSPNDPIPDQPGPALAAVACVQAVAQLFEPARQAFAHRGG